MNSLEKNSSNNNTIFFTKDKIIYFSIFFILTVILLSLTVVFILNIDINVVVNSIGNGLKINNYQFLFLIGLLFFPIIRSFSYIFYFYFHLKKINIHFSFFEWMQLGFITILIISITPSSIGSEPYIIYFLNRKVKNLKKTSAIVLCSSFIGQISSIVITTPSFIWYMANINIHNVLNSSEFTFWFLIIGFFMDYVVLISFIVLAFTTKTHYLFSVLFHKVKKIFKLKYKTNQKIKSEMIENAVFKKEVIQQLKNWKLCIPTFFVFLFYNGFYYIMVCFSVYLIKGVNIVNFWEIFHYANIGITANNFIPLPGSEGTLQIILKSLLSNTNLDVVDINNTIFIWRFFTTQLCAIIGMIILFAKTISYIIEKRKNNEKILVFPKKQSE